MDENVTVEDLESFNPLMGETDAAVLLHAQQATVSNIRDSYHGKFDSFAESIQNGVDAIQKRWSLWAGPGTEVPGGDAAERPQLRVILDTTANTLEVVDNGIGLGAAQLCSAMKPNVTYKRGEPGQRGHKGVGTTYLTYGHDLFQIESKTAAGHVGYRLEGGLSWSLSDPVEPCPSFVKFDVGDALKDFGSGTAVKMRFGPRCNYPSLDSTIYGSMNLWKVFIRSFTAVGLVRLGKLVATEQPAWIAAMKVTLEVKGAAYAGVEEIPFEFPFPHKELPENDVAELQALQNNPQSLNRYSLIYFSRDHAGLMQLLEPELAKLNEESPELYSQVLADLTSGEVQAYASLAYTNRLYEQSWKNAIGTPAAQRLTGINVRGGVLIASEGMVIGEVLPHLEGYRVLRPEQRPRYFLLLHFNGTYRPDIGRKTIPRDKEALVEWLDSAIIRILSQWSMRLQAGPDDATHNANTFAQAQQLLQQQADQLSTAHSAAPATGLSGLVVNRKASSEAEVAAQFVTLVSSQRLLGYTITALPGNSTRYDGLFDLHLTKPSDELNGAQAELGVHRTNFVANAFDRTKKWLEFKLELAALIDDFDLSDGQPSKKYFELVDLVVCWSASLPSGTTEYQLDPITPEARNQRSYPGSTHFLRRPGQARVVEVIALADLIPLLLADNAGGT